MGGQEVRGHRLTGGGRVERENIEGKCKSRRKLAVGTGGKGREVNVERRGLRTRGGGERGGCRKM